MSGEENSIQYCHMYCALDKEGMPKSDGRVVFKWCLSLQMMKLRIFSSSLRLVKIARPLSSWVDFLHVR